MSLSNIRRQETLINLVLWGILFLAPVMSVYIRSNHTGASFNWAETYIVWRQYAVYLAFFLLHNHFLAPMLVYQKRKTLYFSVVGVLVASFTLYQCNTRPSHLRHPDGPHHRELLERHPGGLPPERPHDDERFGRAMDEPAPLDGPRGPIEGAEDQKWKKDGMKGKWDDGKKPMRQMRDDDPPPFVWQHDIIAIIILLLMLAANLGIKLYFKQRLDEKNFADLEKKSLEQQLEYLKYQINPHFLMNTLNNIHALVDIEPEKAKQTIIELSKLLRFVLYEGNKTYVPLCRELAFLNNYIQLMRLRYTDNVAITTDTASLENVQYEVPPLIFITFVENAFKHGVTYKQHSFIDIKLQVLNSSEAIADTANETVSTSGDMANETASTSGDNANEKTVSTSSDTANEKPMLCFECRNSRIPSDDDKHGGLGLENIRKRLDLIYGKSYTLDIRDSHEDYYVRLCIPVI